MTRGEFVFEPVRYHIDLTHRRQHLVTVRVTVPKDCASQAVVSLPCWTPGSYLRRDYIRHMQHISATDATGSDVTLTPLAGAAWQLPADVTTAVTITLELFANDPSVRTNTVDALSALIIPAATCLQIVGASAREHHVTIPATEPNHSVFSLLDRHPSEPDTFVANDYDHLIDGAFMSGEHAVITCDIDRVPHTFVWAGAAAMLDETVVREALTKLARACQDVFDTPLQSAAYTVLTLTGATGSGGLEHRDGAVLHVPENTFTKPETTARFQSLLAHEYLHAWNVKRLVPKALMQLRYDTVVRTSSLWMAEGFTAYYDGLLCVRAGLWEPERLFARFAKIYTDLSHTPGVSRQSLQDASWRAPERQYRRDENAPNAMTEYYAHGSLVALELDALLRGEDADGDGLDTLMRKLWQRHHCDGYTDDDVFAAVAEIANDTIAHRFQSRILTPGLADHSELADALNTLALSVGSVESATPWLGVQLAATTMSVGVRLAATLRNGPAWQAGLTGNDTILALNDSVITPAALPTVLARYSPGDTIIAHVLRPNGIAKLPVTIAPSPATFTVSVDPNATITAQKAQARWLHQTTQQITQATTTSSTPTVNPV